TIKAKLYERLLSVCCEQSKTPGSEYGRPPDAELFQLECALALHGGVKVISAYVESRRSANQEGTAAAEGSAPWNKLAREMRADLGRSESIRSDADLLELLSGRRQKT